MDAPVSVVREFVFHILCMRCYGLYRTEPDIIGRIYIIWGLSGQTLRTATRQELASYLGSLAAACAIYENVRALLRRAAGEAPLPENDPTLPEDEVSLPEDEATLPDDEAPLPESTSQLRYAPFRYAK